VVRYKSGKAWIWLLAWVVAADEAAVAAAATAAAAAGGAAGGEVPGGQEADGEPAEPGGGWVERGPLRVWRAWALCGNLASATAGEPLLAAQVRKTPSWPRRWASSSLYRCIPTGMHAPTRIFWTMV
jgi:hypothetical protein